MPGASVLPLTGEGDWEEDVLEEEVADRRGGSPPLGGRRPLCSCSFPLTLFLSLSPDWERLLLLRRAGEGDRRDLKINKGCQVKSK